MSVKNNPMSSALPTVVVGADILDQRPGGVRMPEFEHDLVLDHVVGNLRGRGYPVEVDADKGRNAATTAYKAMAQASLRAMDAALTVEITAIRAPWLAPMGTSDAELSFYDRLVRPLMKPDDYVLPDDLRRRLLRGGFRAWWLRSETETLGWCALSEHSSYSLGTMHLYGGCIVPNARGCGLGRVLWELRMREVAGTPVTVSIQPDNELSMKIGRALQFERIGEKAPWINFLHPNPAPAETTKRG